MSRNVPKLRFKEFENEWKKKKISDFAIIKGGYAFKSKELKLRKEKYQVIKMSNLYKNELLLERTSSYKAEITDKEREYVLKKNDIVITLTGTVGKRDFGYSHMITDEENLLLNQRLGLIRTKNNANSTFVRNILLNEKFLFQFFESSVGGTGNQANVSTKNIEGFKINIPLLQEQEKIADFFNILDSLIEEQNGEVSDLELYKKGMMQKIFSQEIRFKEENGCDYPEWEERLISELCNISTGKRDTQDKIEGGRYPFFVRSQTVEKIDSYSFDGEAILTAGDGVGVGKVFHYVNCKFDYHQRVYKLSNFENINGRYLYEYFSKNFKREVNKYNAKTSVDSVRLEMITKMKIPYPCLEEQIKIADFLSDIDALIEEENKNLDDLKELKKGLLQQMFV